MISSNYGDGSLIPRFHVVKGEPKRDSLLRGFLLFNADYINRTDTPDEGFTLNILYEGSLSKIPKVLITGKEIQVQEFDIANRPNEPIIKFTQYGLVFIFIILGIGVFFLVMLVVVSPISSILGQKSETKRNKRYANQIFNAIKKEDLLDSHSDEQIKEFVARMLYRRELIWFDGKSPIIKWSFANIKPTKSNYET